MDIIKKHLLFVIVFFYALASNAQNSKYSISSTIGISKPILDNGIGLHLGINPSYPLSSNFSAEAQLSFLYSTINATFLSGNKGKSNDLNALIGGRVYLNREEKINRIYSNLLFGVNYSKEEINQEKENGQINLGLSAGIFYKLRKHIIGISFESPQNLMLKFGFVF